MPPRAGSRMYLRTETQCYGREDTERNFGTRRGIGQGPLWATDKHNHTRGLRK
jgi:hypothetical protein